ncbi:glycosyltransferase family 39 protein [Flaviaesturariibacter amylovorans]|uniref:Glycosyltransferase RgtA/B/C/D-like domain-containing protein n=1 Tax=Flaviaesturariibacter amylovorans TaxID=1084520 RepID=A0ABP8GLX7_9BACT
MNSNRRDLLLLLSLFVLVHLALYVRGGIGTGIEATKYIYQAELLLDGRFPSAPKYYYYLPIILLTAGAIKTGLGFGAVALAQSVFSAFALTLLYKGTLQVFGRQVAFMASLLLCLFPPFFSWDLYLYSESIFISLSLVLYYTVCRNEKYSQRWLLATVAILLLMFFTRPVGVLFAPALFVYSLFRTYLRPADRYLTSGLFLLLLGVMFVFIDRILHGGEDMNAMKPLKEEHVVCFVAQNPGGATLDLKYYDNGLRDIVYYVTHNPGHFAKLMGQRILSFFSMTRPWYSAAHNWAIRVFTVPVYVFFLIGLVGLFRERRNLQLYLVALLLMYPLAITFQCDDWHARFTMPVLPAICVLAACGFSETWKRMRKYRLEKGN